MLESDKYKVTEKGNLTNRTLNAAQQKELKKILKCGIYKEIFCQIHS